MKDRIVTIISHPFFISGVLSLIIISFIPYQFTKHRVEHLETNISDRQNKTFFHDLTNDNKSEKIVYYENNLGNASFEIHNSDGGLIDQWNFNSHHFSKNWELWFFDSDGDGYDEIYHFTKREDSIFLNIDEPFGVKNFHSKEVFIEALSNTTDNMFFSTSVFDKSKNVRDNSDELFFSLNRGFSGNPRNIFTYNFNTGEVLKSSHLTNQSRIYFMKDLDLDGHKEILLANYAAGNTIDTSYSKRSDYHSWFMILDENLQFKFDPIEITAPFSSIHSIPLKNDKDNFDILCRINSKNPSEYPNRLNLFSSDGILLREIMLESGLYFIHPQKDYQEFVLFNHQNGSIKIFNQDFKINYASTIEPKSYLYPMDIDENGQEEWVQVHPDKKTITIFEEGFEENLSFKIPGSEFINLKPFLKSNGEKAKDLFLRDGKNYYLFSYQDNPWYFLKYMTYLLIFLFVLSLVWLMRKGMQYQMEKQREIENEISALQIKNINNQIDPHFVFNAINTISEMTLMENKFEADKFITKFSNFMRGTLVNSDKITTSLKDELVYVENFIQLQQERFKDRFDYAIKVNSDVDTSFMVPKHIVFCYAENAIKHGLSGLKEKGLLKIHVVQDDRKIYLIIEDNGGGIQENQKKRKDSTGNGLKIMDQLIELFHKLYKKRIEKEFIELFDDENNKSGIKVIIKIAI